MLPLYVLNILENKLWKVCPFFVHSKIAALTGLEIKIPVQRMGVVLELPEGGLRAQCKGASEIILVACDKVIKANGEIVSPDESSLNHLTVTIDQFAGEAVQLYVLSI